MYYCAVCKGKLHEPAECIVKKKLDDFARQNDDTHHWGQWKYDTYYRKMSEAANSKDEARREAKQQVSVGRQAQKSTYAVKRTAK